MPILKEGEQAPDFTVKAHTGNTVKLSEQRGKKVLLWFYPMADTPGCTIEGQGLRDRAPQFDTKNVTIFGVSFDDVEANRKFAEKFSFPYLLLCDTDKQIGLAYGAADDASTQTAARIAYLIDETGKIEKS